LTYVTSVWPVTLKPNGFRALYVKYPKGLSNSSQKGYEVKLAILFVTLIFWRGHSVLNEAWSSQFSFFKLYICHHYYNAQVIHLTSHSIASKILETDTHTHTHTHTHIHTYLSSYPTNNMPMYFVISNFYKCTLIAKNK